MQNQFRREQIKLNAWIQDALITVEKDPLQIKLNDNQNLIDAKNKSLAQRRKGPIRRTQIKDTPK